MVFRCADFLCFAVRCQFSVWMNGEWNHGDDDARSESDQWRASMRQRQPGTLVRVFIAEIFVPAKYRSAACVESKMKEPGTLGP